jgi:capsular exopolysaccharide synthesis family protein
MEEQAFIQKSKIQHSSLNIKELFFKYVRFLPLYILFIALSLFGAYMYLRYATEFYRSAGQIIIRDDKNTPSISDRLEQAMQSDSRKNIQTEVEVMQSREMMERVVKTLGLNFNYHAKGKIKQLNIYKIAPFRIEALQINDSSQGFTLNLNFVDQKSFRVDGLPSLIQMGQTFENQFGKFRINRVSKGTIAPECQIQYNSTLEQASMFLGGLVVFPKQNTGILTIIMESTNSHLAADVVNGLMEEYQLVTIEDKNTATQKSLAFIDVNLRERAKELDSIAQKLVSYQKANNIIEPGIQASNYFNRVEQAHGFVQQQRLQLDNALQIQDYLGNNSESLVPSSLGIDDPTLNGMIASYNTAQLERKELLENAQPGHIIVKQKAEEINLLRNKILENVKNIKSSYNNAIGTLRSSSGEAIAQIKTLPNKRQDMINIQNQMDGKMKLYYELLSKREVSAITLASTISNTKVMQVAKPDSTPVKPNRKSIQILAIFIGILIPTIIIVVLELFNDKVNSRSDIEKFTEASILGDVGHSYTNQTLVVTSGNRKVIAEQFRILRSNLQYVLTKAPKPVIMVSSSFSGEGKSFISTNVGAVMALAKKKTIILEFDIRKPKIVSGLGISKGPGLTNYILGETTLEQLPVLVPGYDNLFVLPCGPIPPNPGELLLDIKIEELFTFLRQNFDVIIMDTAPVGMVSDAMTLSRFADCTLYIVRQGHTYKKQIGLIDSYYREGKLPKISLVLNDVKAQAGYGAYGYGAGDGYGYGSGYFEDEPKHKSGINRWFGWLGSKNGSSARKHKKSKV